MMEFSDLALAKFLQVAPELGPMILNFSELQEDTGEDDVVTGVFSLRVGAGVAFVPVVAKGDNIFPIDSIYIEGISEDESGQFRPLTKATITSLMNQVQMSPGKPIKTPKTVEKNPSVYNMINPPRTGKFAYASESRLIEFLAMLPNHIKQATFEKISSEKTIYDSLDRAFGLRTIFDVLKPTENTVADVTKTKAKPQSVVSASDALGAAFTDAMAKDIIVQGFHVSQNPEFSRVAVSYQPFNREGTYQEVSQAVDGGRDHNLVFSSGVSREAYLPRAHELNPGHARTLALFVTGDYAEGDKFISAGDAVDREKVLDTVFTLSPPKLMKELNKQDKFLLITNAGTYLGPFTAWSVVQNHMGTEVDISGHGHVNRLCAYRNHTQDVSRIGKNLYVPTNIFVLPLGNNVSGDLERSTFDASRKQELFSTQHLGTELNLRYDGVEFSGNNQVLGEKSAAMKFLVDGESIDPEDALRFLKQAEETKFVKIFLSKKAADFNPAEIPQSGMVNARDPGDVGPGGAFMPAIQEASKLGDGQVMEATIISQLLQIPDMFAYIEEFLPEISETVDKLGRILFLTRVKLNQLSQNLDSDSVFALINQIKQVYRSLGDSVEKLKEVSTASSGFEPGKQNRQGNGK